MSTRKEKVAKSSAERQARSYKLKPIEGDTAGERIVSEKITGPAELSVSNVKTQGNTIDDKGIAMSQLGNPAEIKKMESRPTISDMLAPFRESIKKDKTDAVKMQKYHALTDVFGALGKMGGAAVGGAIGGNVLDSAPAVGEYQPSRGYVEAFERAKKANDRLRALDEQEFQLAYNKKQKDEDRAYAEKKTIEDRAHQAEQSRIAREFQAEQARLTREWNKAVADGDFARQAALKKEILALQNTYAAADDKRSREYLQMQYDLYNSPMPVMFRDGSMVDMTPQQYEQMAKNYVGQTVGGTKITKDNFDEVLRANPQAFAGYFKRIGVATEQDDANKTTTGGSSEQSYYYYNPITGKTMKSPVPMPGYEMVEGSDIIKPKKKERRDSVETDLTKKWESSEI